MQIHAVPIQKSSDVNVIIGQAHFIKTVEDLYEAIVTTAPAMKFGVAFCEASGACKVRVAGNDEAMKILAADNAMAIGAGHSFVVALTQGFPINILNQIKQVPEVCTIFAATANPMYVIVADHDNGRGIVGVIDGAKPQGIEGPQDVQWRHTFLRTIGYKQ